MTTSKAPSGAYEEPGSPDIFSGLDNEKSTTQLSVLNICEKRLRPSQKAKKIQLNMRQDVKLNESGVPFSNF